MRDFIFARDDAERGVLFCLTVARICWLSRRRGGQCICICGGCLFEIIQLAGYSNYRKN